MNCQMTSAQHVHSEQNVEICRTDFHGNYHDRIMPSDKRMTLLSPRVSARNHLGYLNPKPAKYVALSSVPCTPWTGIQLIGCIPTFSITLWETADIVAPVSSKAVNDSLFVCPSSEFSLLLGLETMTSSNIWSFLILSWNAGILSDFHSLREKCSGTKARWFPADLFNRKVSLAKLLHINQICIKHIIIKIGTGRWRSRGMVFTGDPRHNCPLTATYRTNISCHHPYGRSWYVES